MTNPTALAFGYPGSKIAETDHWLILLRPKQPTFGSLVLVCKETVQAFSEVSPAAFADLQVAVTGIERLLRAQVDYEKINYLMLMMVDKDVHFHVLPRYAGVREHEGLAFPDAGWPAAPALGSAVELSPDAVERLAARFAQAWGQA
ncbi:HIT family protein [Caulobacter segnis]|uniref:Histidine triad (HIT) protein n=2 Tax=Caulobacter segnis TaxID=88688 RepID=D5VKZ8_CAUST|nr:HIT family protein [Caulobacter segnis]ADG11171.1 histidine triad (HIT) protein [Caulobacter segnis ATCC 21756]AVQ02856.1 HIT family protein [Caulobacter segnis]